MDNAKKHWKILHELGTDLTNRVREFMVIGRKGDGVIVVTENGEGFRLGKMWFGWGETNVVNEPTPLHVPELVQMAHGDTHILLLNKRGQIYSMGRNQQGQLGLRTDDKKARSSPQLIHSPHKFTLVRCADDYSLALTEDGKVCAWGCNVFGRVGVHRSTFSLSYPHQIPELDSYLVVAVECGGYHSLALTDQGEVYAWGRNEEGQLGNRSEISTHTPTRIPTPSPVQSMAASRCHTLLLTRTGEVWTCGRNQHGQLSLPTSIESSSRLVKVAGFPPISQIASHHANDLFIAMSSDLRCFVWGYLIGGTSISTSLNYRNFSRKLPSVYSTVESPLCSFSSHPNTPHSVSIPETPPNRLSARMSLMFDNPETSDVHFVVEQRVIHAHQFILRNFSDYFSRMFSGRWLAPVDPEDPIVKVTIPDYSYEAFHAFLHFLYTDCLKVHPDFLPELFELASQYLESDLQQLCLLRMRTTITPVTCCLYYQFTVRHPMPELDAFQQELIQFISTNFPKVIATDAYKSMDDELRKKLIHCISFILI